MKHPKQEKERLKTLPLFMSDKLIGEIKVSESIGIRKDLIEFSEGEEKNLKFFLKEFENELEYEPVFKDSKLISVEIIVKK